MKKSNLLVDKYKLAELNCYEFFEESQAILNYIENDDNYKGRELFTRKERIEEITAKSLNLDSGCIELIKEYEKVFLLRFSNRECFKKVLKKK